MGIQPELKICGPLGGCPVPIFIQTVWSKSPFWYIKFNHGNIYCLCCIIIGEYREFKVLTWILYSYTCAKTPVRSFISVNELKSPAHSLYSLNERHNPHFTAQPLTIDSVYSFSYDIIQVSVQCQAAPPFAFRLTLSCYGQLTLTLN